MTHHDAFRVSSRAGGVLEKSQHLTALAAACATAREVISHLVGGRHRNAFSSGALIENVSALTRIEPIVSAIIGCASATIACSLCID